MARQSLKVALKNNSVRRAIGGLVGCPVGQWAETAQSMSRLRDDIPRRDARSYTVDELVAAALTIDHADRYQWRTGEKGAGEPLSPNVA